MKKNKLNHGFTLIELMIVIAIIAILVITLLFSIRHQQDKAEDSRSKSELDRLKIAFEDYYNDHNCYPPVEWFDSSDDCNSSQLSPYLSNIPCEKKTGLPYIVEKDQTGCVWFKLYATLKSPDEDPQSIKQRSNTGSTKGNYGVSSSNTNVTILFNKNTLGANDTPVANNNPSYQYYYCSTLGNCTLRPPTLNCAPTYTNDPYCGNPSSPCSNTVSTCNH